MKTKKLPEWNLKSFYESPDDPALDRDMDNIERMIDQFCAKYNVPDKKYLVDSQELLKALQDHEALADNTTEKPMHYLFLLLSIESGNNEAMAKNAVISDRYAKIANKLTFFNLCLGKITKENQQKFLTENKLSKYHHLLKNIFETSKYNLTEAEEKICNLKSLPAQQMWVNGNQKTLNARFILWKKKKMTLTEAYKLIPKTKNAKERAKIQSLINIELEKVMPFSEAEINAIFTDKKIEDELRNFAKPYSSQIISNDNEIGVIENLIKTVSSYNHIAHKFYKLKAKIHKLKYLRYYERNLVLDSVKAKYTFEDSVKRLKAIYSELNPKYIKFLDKYLNEETIDVGMRIGKRDGAFCSSGHKINTHILLNHDESLNSFLTFAHEMGHAIHSELSKSQSVLYEDYSTSLAETASTLFEGIAFESTLGDLDKKNQIISLHNKISDSISTIFRQVACFKFELELHETIRAKGYIHSREIQQIHNRHMSSYLGPAVKLEDSDGLSYITWSHIRYFFYVYSYAYGELVSMILAQKYKTNKSFWKSIEQFLSSGSSDSPENILRKIGIDLSDNSVFEEGLKLIENDINNLEKLLK